MIRSVRRSTAVAGAAALCFALASCGGEQDAGRTPSGSSTSAPAAATPSATIVGAEHNAADTTFAHDMIVHHEGAIDMAALVADRSDSEQIKALADRILAAQGPEIETMRTMLAIWGEDAPAVEDEHGDHGGHGEDEPAGEGADPGHDMPGMMSADEMAQLEAASGEQFDRAFLEGMIEHHKGAIEMSADELAKGVNAQAKDLARTITDAQTAEIKEMAQLLGQL